MATPRLLRFKKIHYYIIPLVALVVWWGMLIAMLSAWSIQGHPIYAFMGPEQQDPVYISDIGATNLKPLFISCAGFQAIFFVGTLAMDYWLREHGGKLQPFVSKKQPKYAIAAVICAIIGQLGILFVSIFDTKSYHSVHLSMVAVFIVFNFVACIFNFMNSYIFGNYPGRLSPHHEKVIFGEHKWANLYMVSFFFKCVWLVCAAGFALAFGILMHQDYQSLSAGFEWTISFWYGLLLVFWGIDLFPSAVRHYRVRHPEIYGTEPVRTPIYYNKEDQRSISSMGEPTFVGDAEQAPVNPRSEDPVYYDAHGVQSVPPNHLTSNGPEMAQVPYSESPAIPQPTYQAESPGTIHHSDATYPSPVVKRYSNNDAI